MNKDNRFKDYFIYFITYSILGWFYEVFLEVVIYKWGFSNRGILFGPYCPIYGVGAFIFIPALRRFVKDKTLNNQIKMIPVIFIGCAVIATFVELIASYICEITMGGWPWQTYIAYKYNFQGRIALSPSIRFGLGGMLFIYIIQPLLEKITSAMKLKTKNILFLILMSIVLIDIFVSTIVGVLK